MLDILKSFIDWLLTQFWDIAETLLVALLAVIPLPEWVADIAPNISSMVAAASYPMWLVGFDVGLPIMCSAIGIRFFIRRIPGIG